MNLACKHSKSQKKEEEGEGEGKGKREMGKGKWEMGFTRFFEEEKKRVYI